MWGIDALRRHLDRQSTELRQYLDCRFLEIKERLNTMPTRADIDAAKAQLQQAITDATTRVSADIQALRDQIAAGNPVTDQDLADLQSDIASVANIDAAPTP